MAATSIKLSDELKARIAPLAEADGISPHAWMLRALAAETDRAEKRAEFFAEGLKRLERAGAGAPMYAAEDVFEYLDRRLHDESATRPAPRQRRSGA
jgi:predicted transcriptional regulator